MATALVQLRQLAVHMEAAAYASGVLDAGFERTNGVEAAGGCQGAVALERQRVHAPAVALLLQQAAAGLHVPQPPRAVVARRAQVPGARQRQRSCTPVRGAVRAIALSSGGHRATRSAGNRRLA